MSSRPSDQVSTALYSGERLQPKYEQTVTKPKPLRLEQSTLKSNYSALTTPSAIDPSITDSKIDTSSKPTGEPIDSSMSSSTGIYSRNPAQVIATGSPDPALASLPPSEINNTKQALLQAKSSKTPIPAPSLSDMGNMDVKERALENSDSQGSSSPGSTHHHHQHGEMSAWLHALLGFGLLVLVYVCYTQFVEKKL
jgi:hypothetical protein